MTYLSIVITTTVIGIILAAVWVRNHKTEERYVDWNSFVELVNVDPNDPAAAASVEAYAFLQDNYNENLTPIAAGLTAYYSAFSKASFPDPTVAMWYNISPFFRTEGSTRICPDVRIEDTHIKLSQVPTYSRDEGLHVGNVALTGAPSNKLGVKASASFAYFLMVSIMELPAEGETHELTKVFAHTQNINGITVLLETQSGVPTLTVTFGDEIVASKHPIDTFSLKKPVLIIINKNLQDMTLATFANLDAADILALRTEATKQIPTTTEIEFSNKEMMINSDRQLLMNLHAVGFYRAALTTSKQNDLAVYLAKEHAKMSKYMQQLGSTMLSLQQKVADVKACKFDQTTCDACKAVTDWSNMSTVMSQATDACLAAVHQFCTANPEHSFCACWNTDSPAATTTKCTNYVRIFSSAGMSSKGIEDIDNIDPETLQIIRDKYNLCPCDAQQSCAAGNSQDTTSIMKDVRPFLLTIDPNQWGVNMDDVESYNNLQVDNPYVGDIPKEMTLAMP